jgi:pyroglutamyl-peptidase
MQTILITGFGRFPGSPVNPSGLIAERLVKRRRPAFAGARRIAHVFDVRYDAVDHELPALLKRTNPDIVVMFGVATRARQMRVEERARNRIAMFPDAGGFRPASPTIATGRGAVRNPLPLARLIKAARTAGAAATRSRNAGSYLCNYVYWRGLEASARPDGPAIVIFVHVPSVAQKQRPRRVSVPPAGTRPRTGSRRAVRLDDLVRGGEAIVLAMMSLARPQGGPRRPRR